MAGTSILTGTNSYGATTITAGTLQVGSGGSSGTLGSGAVNNNGSLIFNRLDNFTVSNNISGSGSVTQSGVGITTLTGTNTYNGATTINAGTLKIGTGGSLSGTAVTLNGGSFVVEGSTTNSAVTVNSGNYQVTGTGSTSSSGAVSVSNAIANVDGSLTATSGLIVSNGGTLNGSGNVIGNVTINASTLAPGNSIDSIGVNGNLSFINGSTLEIEYDGIFTDLLTVTGNLDLTGVSLDLKKFGAAAPLNQWFVFATYGTLSGTFGNINANPSISPNHFVLDYNYLGGNEIAFSAIPEPTSLALIGVAAVGGGANWLRRLRKNKNAAK